MNQRMILDRTVEEESWRMALERGSFGVWDLDPRLEMVHYSPQWKARFGFPRIHAPDTTEFWRCRVHPADLDAMHASLRSHLEGRASSYEVRFRLRSNGSGYRTVLSRGRVVERDGFGHSTRMLGTMVDLTGRATTAAPHGLVAEDPDEAVELPRVPLHALLGVACPHAASPAAGGPDVAHESRRLVEAIRDLLDMALHEGCATQ